MYTARRDKSNREVIRCGHVRCSGELARESGPALRYAPGWRRNQTGVWYMTNYAKKRLARGQRPKFHRATAVPADTIRQFVAGPNAGRIALTPTAQYQRASMSAERVQWAKCPRCGELNNIDLDALEVCKPQPPEMPAERFYNDDPTMPDLPPGISPEWSKRAPRQVKYLVAAGDELIRITERMNFAPPTEE